MSRRSCYALEVTHEEIAARIAAVPEPSDEAVAPKVPTFVKRKRNSFKQHVTLSDRNDKYYSCGSIRAQLGQLAKI